ncbi:hypothetical protein FKW77_008513 [Venturia effusa]|uniref:Uncharacterized protein n=1 Tax=Venturia effusa TaxID=50376 RepID=A0A517LJF8_9PEZI|nr:hypothetical protein FKW77_008513 [Venturia effusa]
MPFELPFDMPFRSSFRGKNRKPGSSPAKQESPREDHDQDSPGTPRQAFSSSGEDEIASPSFGKKGDWFGSLTPRHKRNRKPRKSGGCLRSEQHDSGIYCDPKYVRESGETEYIYSSPIPKLPEAQTGPPIKADKALETLIAGEKGYAESFQSTQGTLVPASEQEEEMTKFLYNAPTNGNPPSPPQRPVLKNLTSFVMDDMFDDESQTTVGQDVSLEHAARPASLTGSNAHDAATQTDCLAHFKSTSTGHVDHITGNWYSNDPAGPVVIGTNGRTISAELRYQKDIMRQCAGAWLESQSMLSQIHMDSNDFLARAEDRSEQIDSLSCVNPEGYHQMIVSARQRLLEELIRPISIDFLDILSDEALTPQKAAQSFCDMWEKAVPFASAMIGIDHSQFPILSPQLRVPEIHFNSDGKAELQTCLSGSSAVEAAPQILDDWEDEIEANKRCLAMTSIVAIEDWLCQHARDDTTAVVLEDCLLDCGIGLDDDDDDAITYVKVHQKRSKELGNNIEAKRNRKLAKRMKKLAKRQELADKKTELEGWNDIIKVMEVIVEQRALVE